jgi:putative PIG3 family NAD(P)H quinone oxidoreductase
MDQKMEQAMRAVVAAAAGGPDVLRVVERAIPAPGPGQVLIRVAAAGVNRPDAIQREGKYPPPPGAPDVLGLEVAGYVAALGEGVGDFAEGDAVCALLPGGGYAEYVVADAGSVLPVPHGVSLRDAAGLPETVFTVWHNVFERAALKPGETLLVHGGASGIGTTAIQLAAARGARVFATAGTDGKCRLCERLGAERGINYRDEDFEAALRAAGGADVVLDMVGGAYIQRNLNLLKDDGRLVQIAFLEGSRAELDLMRLMLKRLTITGSTLRARPAAEKARIARAVRENVWPLIESGKFRPVIDGAFPLAQAVDAHRRLDDPAHAGKILLTTGPSTNPPSTDLPSTNMPSTNM